MIRPNHRATATEQSSNSLPLCRGGFLSMAKRIGRSAQFQAIVFFACMLFIGFAGGVVTGAL